MSYDLVIWYSFIIRRMLKTWPKKIILTILRIHGLNKKKIVWLWSHLYKDCLWFYLNFLLWSSIIFIIFLQAIILVHYYASVDTQTSWQKNLILSSPKTINCITARQGFDSRTEQICVRPISSCSGTGCLYM